MTAAGEGYRDKERQSKSWKKNTWTYFFIAKLFRLSPSATHQISLKCSDYVLDNPGLVWNSSFPWVKSCVVAMALYFLGLSWIPTSLHRAQSTHSRLMLTGVVQCWTSVHSALDLFRLGGPFALRAITYFPHHPCLRLFLLQGIYWGLHKRSVLWMSYRYLKRRWILCLRGLESNIYQLVLPYSLF